MTIPLKGGLLAGLAVMATLGAAPALAATCEELAGLAIEGGTVTGTEMVTGGTYTITGGQGPVEHTGLPDFCRVSLTMTPSEASAISVEVWLPAEESWNRRYLAVDNGGFAGSIAASAMLAPLREGYATSSTDTGHTVTDGSLGLDEDLLRDFAYRAVHEMARASKQPSPPSTRPRPSRPISAAARPAGARRSPRRCAIRTISTASSPAPPRSGAHACMPPRPGRAAWAIARTAPCPRPTTSPRFTRRPSPSATPWTGWPTT